MALVSERIPPFDQQARNNIIDHFCPEVAKAAVRASRNNEDCIARVYLSRRGLRSSTVQKRFLWFRNVLLNLDWLEALGTYHFSNSHPFGIIA
jgi:hypothetical protein